MLGRWTGLSSFLAHVEDNDVLLVDQEPGGRFFMSQRLKLQRSLVNVVIVMMLSLMAGGCVGLQPDNGLVQKAQEEKAALQEAQEKKAAASVRLAKAITRYCSITNDTVDARQACIVDRRLSVLPLDQPATP
jgi:hypothetical protein